MSSLLSLLLKIYDFYYYYLNGLLCLSLWIDDNNILTDMRYNISRLTVTEPVVSSPMNRFSHSARSSFDSLSLIESKHDNPRTFSVKGDVRASTSKSCETENDIFNDDIILEFQEANDTNRKNDRTRISFIQNMDAPQVNIFYDKKRIPSYTDRILYKSFSGFKKNLQFLNFKSCENVPSSDHKPVYCDFLLQTTDGGNSIIKNCRNNGIKFEIYSLKATNLAEMDEVLGKSGRER